MTLHVLMSVASGMNAHQRLIALNSTFWELVVAFPPRSAHQGAQPPPSSKHFKNYLLHAYPLYRKSKTRESSGRRFFTILRFDFGRKVMCAGGDRFFVFLPRQTGAGVTRAGHVMESKVYWVYLRMIMTHGQGHLRTSNERVRRLWVAVSMHLAT